jgi:hypothetical protein
MALLDVPDEGGNESDSLCVVTQQGYNVTLGDALVGEPANTK